jgi:hypothetical protein
MQVSQQQPKLNYSTVNMVKYTHVTKEIQYLSQFYTLTQLDNYANGDINKIRELYTTAQPKKVTIGSLLGNEFTKTKTLVTSPDGWVPVTDCIEKIKNEMYICTFESGIRIESSHDHLFQKTDQSWCYARDLKVGDNILSQSGADAIKTLVRYDSATKVYDLSVDHPNHRYYTDRVCSHNSGKSLFMQNISVNWITAGLNGVFITLELSEGLCAMRIDSMLTNCSTKDVFRDMETVEMKVKIAAKKSGHFRIKYLPAQSTVNDIRAYLKELQIQQGISLDFVMVDYLDLLMPVSAKVSPSDLFVKDKYVAEELRNLAKEFNVLCVTASQLNRCLALDTRVRANCKEIEIKDVKVGDWLDSNTGPVEVLEKLPVTKQSVYRIKTAQGKEIICSAAHKFPVNGGLKTINTGLTVGNKLQVRTNIVEIDDEIVEIEHLGERDTIDINVSGNRLFYANDILTHNSAVDEVEFDHSHISGGISKINTADNVFGIFTSRVMRERGKYVLQCMKTRSSSGVGQKVDLDFDVDSLRITSSLDDSTGHGGPNSAHSILGKIKKPAGATSIGNENIDPITGEITRVPRAEINNSKLKNMLNSLKTGSGGI